MSPSAKAAATPALSKPHQTEEKQFIKGYKKLINYEIIF